MVILNSDAGLAIWRVTKPKVGHPERYYLRTDYASGFSLGDIAKEGYGKVIEQGGYRLFTRQDAAKLKREHVLTIDSPATVIYCDDAKALRAVLRKLAKGNEELPAGFKGFASECRRWCAGF
jgi:hypothetical protein